MNTPVQKELFPYRDSVDEAVQELKSKLPITDENELHAALYMYGNTVLKCHIEEAEVTKRRKFRDDHSPQDNYDLSA